MTLPEKFNPTGSSPWMFYGVVGSQAHGLANANSDTDLLGVYLEFPELFLGLKIPVASDLSSVSTEPDVSMHEISKFLRLALGCNPTLLELLWLPELKYNLDHPLSDHFSWPVKNRGLLLSETTVRKAFGGYAFSQAQRLQRREKNGTTGFSSDTKKRTAKHARHCFRLMIMAKQLLETGEMIVDVSEYKDQLYSMGDLAAKNPDEFFLEFVKFESQIDKIESVLPESPDRDAVNDWLLQLRRQQYLHY